MMEATIAILAHCIGGDKNVDGGEIVESFGNQVSITLSLRHPEPRLTGINTTSVGNSESDESFIVPANSNASLVRSGEYNSSFMASGR